MKKEWTYALGLAFGLACALTSTFLANSGNSSTNAIQFQRSRDLLKSKNVVPRTINLHDSNLQIPVGLNQDGGKNAVSIYSGGSSIDSLTDWCDQFVANGFDSNGNRQSTWPFEMMGRPPGLVVRPSSDPRSCR